MRVVDCNRLLQVVVVIEVVAIVVVVGLGRF